MKNRNYLQYFLQPHTDHLVTAVLLKTLSMEVFIKNIKTNSKTLAHHLSGNPLVIYYNLVDSTSIHIFSLNPIQIVYKL